MKISSNKLPATAILSATLLLILGACSGNKDIVSNYYDDGIYHDPTYGGDLLSSQMAAEMEKSPETPAAPNGNYEYYDPADVDKGIEYHNSNVTNNYYGGVSYGSGSHYPHYGGFSCGSPWNYGMRWGHGLSFYYGFSPWYSPYHYQPWGWGYNPWYGFNPYFYGYSPYYGYGPYYGGYYHESGRQNRYNGHPMPNRHLDSEYRGSLGGSGKVARPVNGRSLSTQTDQLAEPIQNAPVSRRTVDKRSLLRDLPNENTVVQRSEPVNRTRPASTLPIPDANTRPVREMPATRRETPRLEPIEPARRAEPVEQPDKRSTPVQRPQNRTYERPEYVPPREMSEPTRRQRQTQPVERPAQRSYTPRSSSPSATPSRSRSYTPDHSPSRQSTSPAPSRSGSPSAPARRSGPVRR